MVGTPPGIYASHHASLGTPSSLPCWLQYTSRVYVRGRLTALTRGVTERTFPDERLTVRPPVSLLVNVGRESPVAQRAFPSLGEWAMLRREPAILPSPVSLLADVSYVPVSHFLASYEGIRRPCEGGLALLLFTRFTVRDWKRGLFRDSGKGGYPLV